jgi:hypothetical protein
MHQVIERSAKQGEEHPETLNALMNLAGVLRKLGEPMRALQLYEVVVHGRERHLEQHPGPQQALSYLSAKYNMAILLSEGPQSQAHAKEQAEKIYIEVLEGRQRLVSPSIILIIFSISRSCIAAASASM